MTYAELQAFVQSFSNRTDLNDLLPTFVHMTEEAAESLRVRQMVKRVDETLAAGETFADAPTDFLAERTIVIGIHDLEFITPEAMDVMQARDLAASRPTHYTYVDGQFRFYPAADQAYTFTLTYYGRIPPLTADTSNWLIEQFPEVYRDGCMVAVALKTRDAEALAIYQGRLDADLFKITERFKDKVGKPLRAAPMFMQKCRLFTPVTA